MTTETLSPANKTRDPRPLFTTAVQVAEPIIAGVRPDQLALPSPCVEFDVKGLLDHLVFVLRRVAALGRGDDAFSPNPMAGAAVDHVNYAADWRAAAAEVDAAWADDCKLSETVVLPWATMTGADVLSMYVSEITTHSWDIAKATGQRSRVGRRRVPTGARRDAPRSADGGPHADVGCIQGHGACQLPVRPTLRERSRRAVRCTVDRPTGGVDGPTALEQPDRCRDSATTATPTSTYPTCRTACSRWAMDHRHRRSSDAVR